MTKLQKTRISSDRRQIVFDFNTGLKIKLFKGLTDCDNEVYDEIEFSLQTPQKGGNKRLEQDIIKALESLRGEGKVKNIKIIIDTVGKIPK